MQELHVDVRSDDYQLTVFTTVSKEEQYHRIFLSPRYGRSPRSAKIF